MAISGISPSIIHNMSDVTITSFDIHDVRFPTNVTGDGTDAMNKECDYSAAYIVLHTSSDLKGQGMTFSKFSPPTTDRC
jgi:L-fuconate dehydratase